MLANKQVHNLIIVAVAVVAAIGLGVWTVSAQGPDTPDPNTTPWGQGHMGGMWGWQGSDGMGHHMMGNWQGHMGDMWGPQGGYGYGMWGMMGDQSLLEAAAAALNLEPAALTEALQSGKPLTEIAAEQGIEPQALVDAILAERQTYLNLMVEQGYMTQAQADAMLTYMNQNLAGHLDWLFGGNGWEANSQGHHCGW